MEDHRFPSRNELLEFKTTTYILANLRNFSSEERGKVLETVKLPSKMQRYFLTKAIKGSFGKEAAEVYNTEALNQPLFSASGRIQLLGILQALLGTVESTIDAAVKAQTWADIQSESESESPRRRQTLTLTSKNLLNAISTLRFFLRNFKEEVQNILLWLKIFWGINRRKNDISRLTPGAPDTPKPCSPSPEKDAPPSTSKPDAPEEDAPTEEEDEVDKDDDVQDLHTLEFATNQGGWDIAAFKWLTLLKFHLKMIKALEPGASRSRAARAFATVFKQVDLKCVVIRTDANDNQMADPRALVERHCKDEEETEETSRALTNYTHMKFFSESGQKLQPRLTCNGAKSGWHSCGKPFVPHSTGRPRQIPIRCIPWERDRCFEEMLPGVQYSDGPHSLQSTLP